MPFLTEFALGQGALARHADAAWKPVRCRAGLADHEEPGGRLVELARDARGDGAHALALGRRPDPEHDATALANERQAPFGRRRRMRERFGDRDSGPVARLLL